ILDHDAKRETDTTLARLERRAAIRSQLVRCEQRQNSAAQFKRREILIIDDQRPAQPPVEIAQGRHAHCRQQGMSADVSLQPSFTLLHLVSLRRHTIWIRLRAARYVPRWQRCAGYRPARYRAASRRTAPPSLWYAA